MTDDGRRDANLGADFHRRWLTAHPIQFASDLSERFYAIAFEWVGIVDLIQWITPAPSIEESDVRPVLHRFYRPVADYVLAGMQITQVFAVYTTSVKSFILSTLKQAIPPPNRESGVTSRFAK